MVWMARTAAQWRNLLDEYSKWNSVLPALSAEGGGRTADLARRHGVSEATIYNWKARYGGLEAERLRVLEDENAKLKRLLAETMLDNAGLKGLLAKNW